MLEETSGGQIPKGADCADPAGDTCPEVWYYHHRPRIGVDGEIPSSPSDGERIVLLVNPGNAAQDCSYKPHGKGDTLKYEVSQPVH